MLTSASLSPACLLPSLGHSGLLIRPSQVHLAFHSSPCQGSSRGPGYWNPGQPVTPAGIIGVAGGRLYLVSAVGCSYSVSLGIGSETPVGSLLISDNFQRN